MKYELKVTSLVLFIIILLAISGTAMAWDTTFRCGSRLVSVGEYKRQVLKTCGEPDEISTYEEGHDSFIFKFYDYEKDRYKAPEMIRGPIHVEIWTYDFGPTRFPIRLRFENGRLVRIETLDKQ